jgi:protein-L-isoaspartate(D-aspartate) O-methyltransferase
MTKLQAPNNNQYPMTKIPNKLCLVIGKLDIGIYLVIGAWLLVISSIWGSPYLIYAEGNSYARLREDMVRNQIVARGIKDKGVIEVMSRVPRHEFVPPIYRKLAYTDGPLPIGEGQTISQPYIVALMTELLQLKGEEKVLEIGTGSGYQAAILAELVKEVYTIEIIESLARAAEERLNRLGYRNIKVKYGDGYLGWPEASPFDAIIVTAAPEHIPQPLIEQLKMGGRMVIPVGEEYQELLLVTKTEQGTEIKKIIPVIFVPMRGKAQSR